MRSPVLILATCFALLLMAALIFPLFWNWQDHRSELEAYGRAVSGFEVKIKGDISVSLLPMPRLKLRKLSLHGTALDNTAEITIDLARFQAGLSLPALIKGQLQFDQLNLVQPVITINTRTRPVPFEPVLEKNLSTELKNRFSKSRIKALTIIDGTVTLESGTPEQPRTLTLTALDATLSIETLKQGPYKVKADAKLDGVPYQITLNTGRLEPGEPLALIMRLANPGQNFNARFSGQLADITGTPALAGTLTMQGLPQGHALIGPWPATTHDWITHNGLSLSATLNATAKQANLSDLKLIGERVRLGGDIVIDIANQAMRLDLKSTTAELEPLISFAETFRPAAPDPGAAEIPAPAQKPQKPQKPMIRSLQLTYQTAIAKWQGKNINAFQLTLLKTATGPLTLENLTATLPGGGTITLKGQFGQAGVEQNQKPFFTGSFLAETSDIRHTLKVINPDSAQIIKNPFTDNNGAARLSGQFSLGASTTIIDKINLTFGDNHLTGHLSWDHKPGAPVIITLGGGNIDLAPYLKQPAEGVVQIFALPQALRKFLSLAVNRPLTTKFQIKQLTLQNTTLNNITGDIEINKDRLQINEVSFHIEDHSTITLNGALAGLDATPLGQINLNLNADNFEKTYAAILPYLPAAAKQICKPGPGLACLLLGPGKTTLQATANFQKTGAKPSFTISLKGNLDQASLELKAAFENYPAEASEKNLTLTALLFAPDDQMLWHWLTAGNPKPPPHDEKNPFSLEVEIKGNPDKKLALTAEVVIDQTETRFFGQINQNPAGLSYEGRLTIEAQDITSLLAHLPQFSKPPAATALENNAAEQTINGTTAGIDAATTATATIKTAIKIDTVIAGTPDELVLSGLKGLIGPQQFELNATLRLDQPRPRLKAVLSAEYFDLGGFIGLCCARRPADHNLITASPLSHWSNQPFADGLLALLDGELKLNIKQAQIGAVIANDLTAEMTFEQNRLALTVISGQLYQGALNYQGRLELQNGVLTHTGKLTLQKADLKTLFADLFQNRFAEGSATLSLNLNATGRTPAGFASSLNGGGQLTITDGKIHAGDWAGFFTRLETIKSVVEFTDLIATMPDDGAILAPALTSALHIQDGLLQTGNIGFTYNHLTGWTKLFIDLATMQIDNQWHLARAAQAALPGIEIIYHGDLTAPRLTLNADRLKAYMTVREFEENLKKLEARIPRQATKQTE